MAHRVALVLLLLTLATAAATAFTFEGATMDTAMSRLSMDAHHRVCHGVVGDCMDMEEEMMMSSESARRTLAQRRYISYDAMKKNNVPCSKRGNSYYNCNQRQAANPYRRGCNQITRCSRSNW